MEELIWKRIKENEFVSSFISSRNQSKIYVKKITHETTSGSKEKAFHFFLAHDLAGYHGRYARLMEWAKVNKLNINFYLIDFAGHGLSSGTRGHVESISNWTDDLSAFLNLVEKEKNSIWSVLGHGVGALAILDLVNRFDDKVNHKIDKIILSNFIFDFSEKKIMGQDQILDKLSFFKSIFNHSKPLSFFEAHEILSSIEEQVSYLSDPLIARKPTFQSIIETKNRIKTVFQESYFIDKPILLLESEGPYILKNGINSFAKGGKKEFLFQKSYPNMRYDLYNDTGKELVFTDIYKWIQE